MTPPARPHTHTHVGATDASRPDTRYLGAALGLIIGFMLGEAVVGVVASSLVLVSDAGHMLTDAAAIGLALLAGRVAGRPARGNLTYGLRRVEILSAQINGLTLLLLGAWFGYEAVRRLLSPPEVAGGWVLGTALVGVAADVGGESHPSEVAR